MADDGVDKPLRKISEAFKELYVDVEVAPFSRACSLTSPLFGCLGIAFKFAETDYVAKVDDLLEASKSIMTLQALLNHDIEENTVKKAASKDYAEVFAPYHGWAMRKAVGAGMYALPPKAQRLLKLNINAASAKTYM